MLGDRRSRCCSSASCSRGGTASALAQCPTALDACAGLAYGAVGGLRVLHSPGPALLAMFFQILGWTAAALRRLPRVQGVPDRRADRGRSGSCCSSINVALAFPLWPGSVGLFQAATALALLPYGIAYQHGFAYGIGLQAIEMSVGIGLGLLFLAREGISFAMLKQIPR